MKKELDRIKTNKKNPIENIKLKEKSRDNIVNVDFSFFCFPSIYLSYFTNYFKDEKSYNSFMDDFYCKTLNYLKDKTYAELEANTHSHSIEEQIKVKLINKILSAYKEKFPNLPTINMQMRDNFYQISTLSGRRIIGMRYKNIFNVLFFDPYHLIYKDDKFNNDRRSYLKESTFHIEDNLTIFDSSHLLNYEKCTCCEVMEEICK